MVINLKKYRLILIVSVILLSLFGVFMVKESSKIWASYLYNDQYYFFKRQSIYFIIGMISFFIGIKIKESWIRKYGIVILIISYILLALVLIPGIGITKNGSTSWLGIGSFSFQPSEFFKIGIIVFNSSYLSSYYQRSKKIHSLFPVLVATLLGIGLIMFQPDFGTCMVILGSIFIQILLSKLPGKWFVSIIFLGIIGIFVLS